MLNNQFKQLKNLNEQYKLVCIACILSAIEKNYHKDNLLMINFLFPSFEIPLFLNYLICYQIVLEDLNKRSIHF